MATTPAPDPLRILINQLRDDFDGLQLQLYIVTGVLGGICLILLISVFIMIAVAMKMQKRIKEFDQDRRVQAEINVRKFSGYTGEEVQRRLQTGSSVTGRESEYAFNFPVHPDYKLNMIPRNFQTYA